jgi:hypothetical protein
MSYVIVARLDDTEAGPFELVARGVSYPVALAIIEFLGKQNIQCYKTTISERHELLMQHKQWLMTRFSCTQPQED